MLHEEWGQHLRHEWGFLLGQCSSGGEMNPPSRQGEGERLGPRGRGRCPVSLHGTGQSDGCWELGRALLQQEVEGGAEAESSALACREVVRKLCALEGKEQRASKHPQPWGDLSSCCQVQGAKVARRMGTPSAPLPKSYAAAGLWAVWGTQWWDRARAT